MRARLTAAVAVLSMASVSLAGAAADGPRFRTTIRSGGARWATVRNAPGAYVIGDGRDGTRIAVERSARRNRWWLGRVGSPVRHCGWVLGRELPGLRRDRRRHRLGGRGHCRSLAPRAFSNGVKNSSPKNDGAKARLYTGRGCDSGDLAAYGNVSPWGRRSHARDRFRRLREGIRVLWRYVSRDGRWVMVRDPEWSPALGGSNWFFVRSACLAAPQRVGCFRRARCRRRVGRRDVGAFFGTKPFSDPYISVQRSYNGEWVNFIGVSRCPRGTGQSVYRVLSYIPIARDGAYHRRGSDGDGIDGRFRGDSAIGSFRIVSPDCDTGEIPFSVPRRP